jgi:hypothetical protein
VTPPFALIVAVLTLFAVTSFRNCVYVSLFDDRVPRGRKKSTMVAKIPR